MVLVVKNWAANAGDGRDSSSIHGSGRSPRGGHGNPLQYSCLENPMDRGAWQATVQRVAHFSSVQSLSHIRLFVTPWTAAHLAPLSITNSQSLLKLMSIEPVIPSNHVILCCPLLSLPSIFPSIRVFSNRVSSSHQVAKMLELQLQHQSTELGTTKAT